MSVLFAEHSVRVALDVCDRAYIQSEGPIRVQRTYPRLLISKKARASGAGGP